MQIDLKLAEVRDPLAEVKQRDADVAVVVRPDDKDRQRIRLVRLLDDPYHAVLPTEHPLAARCGLNLADPSGEPWTGSEPPGACLDVVVDACAAAGFSPNFAASSEDYATALGFVAARLGVGLIPRLGLGGRHPGVAVRKVHRPEPVRPIYVAVGDAAMSQSAMRTFVQALRRAAESGS